MVTFLKRTLLNKTCTSIERTPYSQSHKYRLKEEVATFQTLHKITVRSNNAITVTMQ